MLNGFLIDKKPAIAPVIKIFGISENIASTKETAFKIGLLVPSEQLSGGGGYPYQEWEETLEINAVCLHDLEGTQACWRWWSGI